MNIEHGHIMNKNINTAEFIHDAVYNRRWTKKNLEKVPLIAII